MLSHLHVLFDLFLLVSQLSKGVNNQTCSHRGIAVSISYVLKLPEGIVGSVTLRNYCEEKLCVQNISIFEVNN